MIEFIIPAVFIVAGILCIIFPQRIGVAFCRLGKATWRTSTFGLTDMARFYPEDKAPKIFRLLGVAWILLSIPWVLFAVSSVSGPGAFAAMRESRGYLREQYGSVSSMELSTQPVTAKDGDYLITYRFGAHAGILRASWRTDHYEFKEEKKEEPNQSSQPTPGS